MSCPRYWTPAELDRFREMLAAGHGVYAIMKAFRCAQPTVYRIIRDHDVGQLMPRSQRPTATRHPKHIRRPTPADFAERAKTMTLTDLAKHYVAAGETITRWCTEGGITAAAPKKARPLPDGYRATRGMLRDAVCKRYDAGEYLVRRWDIEAGIDRAADARMRRLTDAANPAPLVQRGRLSSVTVPCDLTRRDTSTAGQAADFLRRLGPVARCDADGKFNANGSFWRRGATVLTADDVIARAERNGWQRDAWSTLA